MGAVEYLPEELMALSFPRPRIIKGERWLANEIANRIANEHGVDMSEMFSRSRHAHLIAARRDLYIELRKRGWSYPAIGRFVNRDHTTVMTSVRGRKPLTEEQKLAAKVRRCSR